MNTYHNNLPYEARQPLPAAVSRVSAQEARLYESTWGTVAQAEEGRPFVPTAPAPASTADDPADEDEESGDGLGVFRWLWFLVVCVALCVVTVYGGPWLWRSLSGLVGSAVNGMGGMGR